AVRIKRRNVSARDIDCPRHIPKERSTEFVWSLPIEPSSPSSIAFASNATYNDPPPIVDFPSDSALFPPPPLLPVVQVMVRGNPKIISHDHPMRSSKSARIYRG